MSDKPKSRAELADHESRAFNTFAQRVKSHAEQQGKYMTDTEIRKVVAETAEAVERKQISNFYKKD